MGMSDGMTAIPHIVVEIAKPKLFKVRASKFTKTKLKFKEGK